MKHLLRHLRRQPLDAFTAVLLVGGAGVVSMQVLEVGQAALATLGAVVFALVVTALITRSS